MPKEWTALKIASKLKPRATRYTTCVARNLYVITQPSGSQSWAVRFGGKKQVLGLVDLNLKAPPEPGQPEIGQRLSLLMAKQLAARVLQDPEAEHRKAKERNRVEKEAEGNKFGALVRQFAEEHLLTLRKGRKMAKQLGLVIPKTLGAQVFETKNGLAQRWAEKDVREITAADIYSVLAESRRQGTPGLKARKKGLADGRARDLRTPLVKMFRWLKEHRHIDVNPCTDAWRPPSAPSRERVLTTDEIKKFWHACDEIHHTFGAVFKLLLLTGCRLREISEMRWSEIQDDRDELHLSGSRTKNKKAHVVPLPSLAMDIIRATPRIEGPFVFTTNGKVPISGWSKMKRALDKAMGNPEPWRLHDLRRSAITGMNELGIAPHVVELIVNHVGGHRAAVAGIYNKSVQMPERRKALRRWATHISGLVSGDTKVVALRSH